MGQRTRFYFAINKEKKYYGFNFTGIIFGAVVGIFFGLIFGILPALCGCVISYKLGDYLSSLWFIGRIQGFLYWKLPSKLFIKSKKLPASNQRIFM